VKLLFLNQYYWPDSAATAQMLTDLCEYLAGPAGGGHEVHVIASRGNYDTGSQTGQKTLRKETRRGVHIHRVRAIALGKTSLAGQAIDFASFHLLVGLRTLFSAGRYDAIVTLTTPPLIGIYATAARAISRTKHVCWVMDLHPDCEFALGVMNPRKLLPRMFAGLNDGHLRRADACVVLGRCMRDRLLTKRVADARIRLIPLWGHDEQGAPPSTPPTEGAPENPLRRELGLQGKFIVGYSGNAGYIHAFDEICGAALALRDDPRFFFLFIGGGRRLGEVKAFGESHQLTNLRVLPYFPRERLRDSLALPDAHLISLKPGLEGISVPSKLYGIMAATRPAVFIGPAESETARLIHETDCGRAITSGDTAGLLATLRALADDAPLRARLGANGRAAFDSTYNAAARCEAWRLFLDALRD
jgi:glycosyltransferase involved in cell wall biosynthesis